MKTPDYPNNYLHDVSVSELAWLSGTWHGRVGEDLLELHYSQPKLESMMGMFRWMKGEAIQFYEFILIETDPETRVVFLKIKHFNRGAVGWEEKDESITFGLVDVSPNRTVFIQEGTKHPTWYIKEKHGNQIHFYFESTVKHPMADQRFIYDRV